MPFVRPSLAAALLGLAAAAFLAPPAGAQQVFRIVGPDGKVTFSDKPPVEPSAKNSTTPSASSPSSGSGNAVLPFELRQVVNRYPVTLYTGTNCGPCGSGRAFLSSRGVPFSEKTITSNEDVEALQRLSGASGLPFLTIGGQQLKGYSEVEWSQFLDAAGYPKTSQLPASFRPAPPAPLVAVQQPAAPASAAARAEPPRAAAPVAPPASRTDNPAGIKF
ncbi:MAG: glutaredoxin family protein [Ramlibacter sp.]